MVIQKVLKCTARPSRMLATPAKLARGLRQPVLQCHVEVLADVEPGAVGAHSIADFDRTLRADGMDTGNA